MWLQICQGLMLLGFAARVIHAVKVSAVGREAQEPTGFAGIFASLVVMFLIGLVTWRSGAFSTILGTP